MNTKNDLSYDGCGINGPDEYRTRIATFTNKRSKESDHYGRLFAAAPDLLAALETIAARDTAFADSKAIARAALAAAKGEDV